MWVYSIYIYIYMLVLVLLVFLLVAMLLREKQRRIGLEYELQALTELHVEASQRHAKMLDKVGRERVEQSRRVLKGKISEELFPLMAQCPYLPADLKFIGMPVDYIVFDGYSDAKDDGGEIREIVFADIKTGGARLSSHQSKIKKAVQDGRVRWETIRIREDGTVVFERD